MRGCEEARPGHTSRLRGGGSPNRGRGVYFRARTIHDIDAPDGPGAEGMHEMISWVFLILAGLIEVAWALSLKYAEGFTRLWPSLFAVGSIALSMVLLSAAMRELPIGLAYGVFVGMGAIGATFVGIMLFGEPASPLRFFFLALLIASLVGLKMTA